ncbi:MAG: DUF418 domain-containing protein, partial [Acidobacteria bacterium]|nr:DUF418 domain-containing protein [Acidobacteriota bacterium]
AGWQRRYLGVVLGSLQGAIPLLIGLLALRLGVFERHAVGWRLLIAVTLIGVPWWVFGQFRLDQKLWPAAWVIPSVRVAAGIKSGFGLAYRWQLGLHAIYILAITLLVDRSQTWERRLTAVFGAAGRMALTNYVIQFAVIGIVFGNYAIDAKTITPQLGLAGAGTLFGALIVFSRWWLARFRFGPAEWLLRSLTYARFQPFRRPEAVEV